MRIIRILLILITLFTFIISLLVIYHIDKWLALLLVIFPLTFSTLYTTHMNFTYLLTTKGTIFENERYRKYNTEGEIKKIIIESKKSIKKNPLNIFQLLFGLFVVIVYGIPMFLGIFVGILSLGIGTIIYRMVTMGYDIPNLEIYATYFVFSLFLIARLMPQCKQPDDLDFKKGAEIVALFLNSLIGFGLVMLFFEIYIARDFSKWKEIILNQTNELFLFRIAALFLMWLSFEYFIFKMKNYEFFQNMINSEKFRKFLRWFIGI